jgi:hypothetical protein
MKHFVKTYKDFQTKLDYHEYLKNGLYGFLREKLPYVEFLRGYPPNEPSGIDIVGLLEILGKKREIMAIEVLGIAEETVLKHHSIQSGQLGKIMTDISKLLFRSSAPVKVLVFSTTQVRDHMRKMKERNLKRGYLNWQQIEFYEINGFLEKLLPHLLDSHTGLRGLDT